MNFLVVLSVLALQLAVAFSGDATTKLGYVPQVAFICNKPAMHITPGGAWESDANTGCLNQPKDILDYCKKLYPSLDITNVMESPEPATIANWCRGDQKTCSQSHTVYPYRCIVGQFESEPLLVPEHCQFDHVHDASKCLSEATWHGRAFEECGKKLMLLQSSSMLMPCGTELFSGVEFVCCPKSKSVERADATSAPVVLKSDGADAAPRSPTDPMQNFGGALSTAGDGFESDEDSDEDDDDDVVENENADSILNDLKAGNVGPVITQTEKPTAAPKVTKAPAKPKQKPNPVAPSVDPVTSDDDDDDDDYEDDDDDYFNEGDVSTAKPAAAAASATTAKPAAKAAAPKNDDVPLWRLYLAGDLAGTEHEYDKEQQLFEEVMVSWRADFGTREQQLKKDWEEAKANVKQTAGDQATLNAVSEEFRRSFNTLKDQGNNEHIRLLDVHDQRIQSRLMQRQKVATKRLTDAIQNAPADAEEVADYLEDLIDIEEKQKKHAVNYFSKLRNIQPSSADKALGDLKQRIRRVEDQLKQSMELLKKLPEKDVNKIKPEITAYLKTYQDVEDAASLMMRLVPSPVQQAVPEAAKAPKKDDKKVAEPANSSEEDNDEDPALGLLGRDEEEDEDDDFNDEEEGAGVEVKPKQPEPVEFNNKVKAEIGAIRAEAERESSIDSSSTLGLSTALVIGSAIAAAFLLILVVGLLVYRSVSRRRYAGRMLVTTAISPEERHVVNMQSNGYENPTYKYFYEVHA